MEITLELIEKQRQDRLSKIPLGKEEHYDGEIALINAQFELLKILFMMHQDITAALQNLAHDDQDQFRRRVVCRTTFAAVEGITYRLKRLALRESAVNDVELSIGEQVLLREEAYDIRENGRVRVTSNFPRLKNNVRFTFGILAKVMACKFELNVGGPGWEHFCQAIAVRNRLTHPKTGDDLAVTDAEMNSIVIAGAWFTGEGERLVPYIAEYVNNRPR